MFFYFTVAVGALFIAAEIQAFREVSDLVARSHVTTKLVAWSSLVGCGVLAVRYVGFAEYPLPFTEEMNVSGFGLPVLALATIHGENSVLDLGGIATIPAIVADIAISSLLPVLFASFPLIKLKLKRQRPQYPA